MTCTQCNGTGLMVIPVEDKDGLSHRPRFLCTFCYGTGYESPTWEQAERLANAINELRKQGIVGAAKGL